MNALAASGLDASRLELEITESVLLDKTERNIEILNQLRDLGARSSMDDFGTGYSSIGYLHNFRFDKIKIDQSFVRDVPVAAVAPETSSRGLIPQVVCHPTLAPDNGWTATATQAATAVASRYEVGTCDLRHENRRSKTASAATEV